MNSRTMCPDHPEAQANISCKECGRVMCPKCIASDSKELLCDACYRSIPRKPVAAEPEREPVLVTRKRPFGITLLAFLFLFGVLLQLVAKGPAEYLVFGTLLKGVGARVVQMVLTGVAIYLGIGFIKGWPPAWRLGIAYFGVMLANALATMLVPGAIVGWLRTQPQDVKALSTEQHYMILLFTCAIFAAVLTYVVRQRGYFEAR